MSAQAMNDDPVPHQLQILVDRGALPPALVAHLSILLDARVPLVVSGPARATVRERIADLLARSSLLPEGGEEINVAGDERFSWLSDPSGIGCTIDGAGSAPRSPRGLRLRAKALLEGLDSTVTRVLVRSLVRGFPLIASAAASDLSALFDRLRTTPYRIPEDDVQRLGALLFFADSAAGTTEGGEGKLLSAYLLHAPDLALRERRAPTILFSWSEGRAGWDDFAWAAIPDLAARCGISHEAYATLLARREAALVRP